jgi:hypothetical protein
MRVGVSVRGLWDEMAARMPHIDKTAVSVLSDTDAGGDLAVEVHRYRTWRWRVATGCLIGERLSATSVQKRGQEQQHDGPHCACPDARRSDCGSGISISRRGPANCPSQEFDP